jgi:hypothetical protein
VSSRLTKLLWLPYQSNVSVAMDLIALSRGPQIDDWRWRHKVDRKVYSNRAPVDSVLPWNRVKIPTLLMEVEYAQRIDASTMAQEKSRALNIEVAEVPYRTQHITLNDPASFIQVAPKLFDRIS